MIKDISVVLLGAGRSLRFKSQTIKQNFKIHNKTLFSYSRDFFNRYFSHSQRYLVVNSKVKITNLHDHEKVILGSSSRIRSLNKCLKYLDKNNLFTKYMLIHDIARPILNITDIEALINEMKYNIDGSSLGYPMTNAIKEIKKIRLQIYHVIICGCLLHHKYSKLFNFITQYNIVCLIIIWLMMILRLYYSTI